MWRGELLSSLCLSQLKKGRKFVQYIIQLMYVTQCASSSSNISHVPYGKSPTLLN